MKVASIHVYPLKGARGLALPDSDVLWTGLRHDRRFMLLDKGGAFVTQRARPRLALVDVALGRGRLTLGGEVTVSLDDGDYRTRPRRPARIWKDEVEVVEASAEASSFLSDHLGESCTLVYMPDDVVRPVEPPHGERGDRVGLADGYPILVASLASLADLNARLAARGEPAVSMDRFRPNLVVDGSAAYDEERYERAEIGSLSVRLAKRCARCQVTTVDQATAEVGMEPLRTLATYRKEGNEVFFAENAIPEVEGRVSVGDPVVYA